MNSPIVIQNDSPSTFGSSGGIIFDGVRIQQQVPRPWITTHVDPTTRLLSIGGQVTVSPPTGGSPCDGCCRVNASKPSDVADLVGVDVVCEY
jgi:hypothetical protein